MGLSKPRFIRVLSWLYRSPLPLAREVGAFAAIGGRSVVDLTRRDRGVVERACVRHGLQYLKYGMVYDFDAEHVDAAAAIIVGAPRPVLVHCFHGRDRTGAVVARLLDLEQLCR